VLFPLFGLCPRWYCRPSAPGNTARARRDQGADRQGKTQHSVPPDGHAAPSKVPEVTLVFWAIKIAATTFGETAVLFTLLLLSLFAWYRSLGSIAIDTVSTPRAEMFYWVTIMFSQTPGTALGDWSADSAGLGYVGAAVIFSALLALVVAAYFWTRLSRTLLFWAAFVLTRPLGAVVGDFLDKPLATGGLALSRYSASFALLAFIIACVLIFPQRAARQRH
jgi:uncharacterized membrane-anchored protein